MADRSAEFLIRFEGDDTGSVRAVLAALKREVKGAATEMQRSSEVELFRKVEQDAQKAAQAFETARQKVAALRGVIQQVEATGGTIGAGLKRQMEQAERAFSSASKELQKQNVALENARNAMSAAGIDASKLAAEERKLATAIDQANKAAAVQANKDVLGLKTYRDIQPEIQKVIQAFNALKQSGTLTFSELGLAQNAANKRIKELRAEVGGLGQAFAQVKGQVIAFGAAMAGIVAVGVNAAKSYREFAQQMAAISSITPVNEQQLAALTDQVRDLARTMGVDAVESAKALYDIIGSGVEDPAQAFKVLEQASQAAIAGITSVDVAARAGVLTMNAYGMSVSDLGSIFDVMFKVVQDGVITFPDLANNIGEVIPVARLAGVSLETVGAAFVTITRNGINASETATSLRSAIQNFAAPAPEAAARMRELGIELGSFEDIIRQISERDLSLPQLREIVSDTRALRAVSILTQQFKLFSESMDSAQNAAGAMTSAYRKLAATPQAQVDRFNAAMTDLNLTIGKFVTEATPAVELLTKLVNGFNTLSPATKSLVTDMAAVGIALVAMTTAVKLLGPAINAVVAALRYLSVAAASAGSALTAASVALGTLQAGLAFLLGFKIGEQLYQNFEPIRKLGDMIGITLGRIDNAVGMVQHRIRGFFTGNRTEVEKATETYRRNAEILDGMWSGAVGGATEKSRQLAAQQEATAAAFNKSRDAITKSATEAQTSINALLAAVNRQIEATDNALGASRQRLQQLADGLRESVDKIRESAQRGIAEAADATQRQLAALGAVQQTELARIKATTELQKKAAAEQLALLVKFNDDLRGAYQKDAEARLAIAGKSKEDITRVERELIETRRGQLQQIVEAFRQHAAQQLAIQTEHAQKLKALEQERVTVNENVDNQIREIRRSTMSAYSQYADRVLQIDQSISKAREALANGDTANARKYAEQAIALSGQIASKIEDGGRVLVSQSSAAATSIGKIEQARRVLNDTIAKEADAHKTGEQAAKAAHLAALGRLKALEDEYDRVTKKADEGINVKVNIALGEIDKELVKLEGLVKQRELLAPVKLLLDNANQQIEALKKQLAEGGIPVNLTAQMESIHAALKEVKDAKPELTVLTDKASAAVGEIIKEAKTIDTLRPELTIESNAPAVQGHIDNLKKPTSSTHTIYVERVNKNAAGGPVTARGYARGGRVGGVRSQLQRYATGGPVFRAPSWRKVPGTGNQDTVPALLREGAFVINKRASQLYGDSAMRKIASGAARFRDTLSPRGEGGVQRYFGGGKVGWGFGGGSGSGGFDGNIGYGFGGGKRPEDIPMGGGSDSPFFGDVKGGTKESQRDFEASIFDEPDLPKDPRELERLVLAYSNAVAVAARSIDGSHFWAPALKALSIDIKDYESRKTAEKLAVILRRSRGIGLNLGITKGTREGFDVDGRKFHRKPAKAPPGLANAKLYSYDFYAEGGETKPRGTDRVRALLTPGEWVMPREAVRKYGSNFMAALNDMRLPRLSLDAALEPPRVHRFAQGGQVPGGWAGQLTGSGGDFGAYGKELLPQNVSVTINANAGDLLSEENVRRFIAPVLRDMMRRS